MHDPQTDKLVWRRMQRHLCPQHTDSAETRKESSPAYAYSPANSYFGAAVPGSWEMFILGRKMLEKVRQSLFTKLSSTDERPGTCSSSTKIH